MNQFYLREPRTNFWPEPDTGSRFAPVKLVPRSGIYHKAAGAKGVPVDKTFSVRPECIGDHLAMTELTADDFQFVDAVVGTITSIYT